MSLGVKQVVGEVEGPKGFQLGDFINEGTWQSVKNGKPQKIQVGMHVEVVEPPSRKKGKLLSRVFLPRKLSRV